MRGAPEWLFDSCLFLKKHRTDLFISLTHDCICKVSRLSLLFVQKRICEPFCSLCEQQEDVVCNIHEHFAECPKKKKKKEQKKKNQPQVMLNRFAYSISMSQCGRWMPRPLPESAGCQASKLVC